jgi:hypothetical protein
MFGFPRQQGEVVQQYRNDLQVGPLMKLKRGAEDLVKQTPVPPQLSSACMPLLWSLTLTAFGPKNPAL